MATVVPLDEKCEFFVMGKEATAPKLTEIFPIHIFNNSFVEHLLVRAILNSCVALGGFRPFGLLNVN